MQKAVTNMDRAMEFALSKEKHLQKLDEMIGLQAFKSVMQQIISTQKRRIIAYSRGREMRPVTHHMCFIGNPGTGKTEMARMAAELLYAAGVTEKKELIVAGRSDLVGEYVGKTALKTKDLLKKASGGVLLIDEAYALMDDRDGSYGDEAINTLVEEMENIRSDTVLIFAGYPDRMKRFLRKNPGLQSRIPHTVWFPDYSVDELCRIAKKMAADDGYSIREDVYEKLIPLFAAEKRREDFGNARYVRNLIEQAETRKADGIDLAVLASLTDDELFRLTPSDFGEILTVRNFVDEKRIGFAS